MGSQPSYEDIAERLVEWVIGEEAIRALWLEGTKLEDVRRPYDRLELHLSADEPQYPGVLSSLEGDLGRILGAIVEAVEDTPRFAKELRLRVGARAVSLIAEQSHLLAKRPRAEVVPLVDKTGHLPHVLDYSLRQPGRG